MLNDNNVHSAMPQDPKTVSAVKQYFNQYFSTIEKKDFKQF